MARHKRETPAQIAAREHQRKYDALMREKIAPGPNLEAMALPANTDIEARKIGRSTYARRAPWYDRVLVKNPTQDDTAAGYRAYERLLDLHAVAMGHDGGKDDLNVGMGGCGSHELTNDRRMRAGREKAAVLDRVGAQNRRLIELLLTHPSEAVATWGAAVWVVFRERSDRAQAALVRAAATDLALAFALIDTAPRRDGIR